MGVDTNARLPWKATLDSHHRNAIRQFWTPTHLQFDSSGHPRTCDHPWRQVWTATIIWKGVRALRYICSDGCPRIHARHRRGCPRILRSRILRVRRAIRGLHETADSLVPTTWISKPRLEAVGAQNTVPLGGCPKAKGTTCKWWGKFQKRRHSLQAVDVQERSGHPRTQWTHPTRVGATVDV